MRNLNVLVICLAVLLVSGCSEGESKPEATGKYTVFIGNSIIATGYPTNAVVRENGFVIFKGLGSEKENMVPDSSIFLITIN